MRDKLGRKIEYLRISVTQKCNLNCIYCKPGKGHMAGEYSGRLTTEEFRVIVEAMAALGINKVRLTGGEPLTRPDICEIVAAVSNVDGIQDISLTTNGLSLASIASDLKKAGLKRVNISLDSLNDSRFKFITGGGNLKNTIAGIDAALAVGLSPVKINVVLIKGINDSEIDEFIQLAKERPLEVRFIELMPVGNFGEENKEKVVYNSEIIAGHPELISCQYDGTGPAKYYRIQGYAGKIGFISPVSHKFCSCCNRIRLTCDGKIKPCLGDNGEVDIIEVLRERPDHLREFIEQVIYNKPKGHNFETDFFSDRNMSMIGG